MSGNIVCAKYDPTNTHFASAVQALDTHQVRVQALVVSQNSLNTLYSLNKGLKLSTLEWISSTQLALCLTNGSILIYSPSSNSVVAELEGASDSSITDFHFSTLTNTAWSADISGNLFEWDLQSHKLIQRLSLSEMLDSSEAVSKVTLVMYEDEPHLLVGTQNVYLIDPLSKTIVKTFPAHIQPIISIYPVASDQDLFLTAAEGDRFVNIYSISKNTTRAVLVAQSAVSQLTVGVHGQTSIVSVITENGTLEVFKDPLSFEAPATDLSKKRRKHLASNVQSKHSDATVTYSRPEDEIRSPQDERLYINAISATENILHTTWLENGYVSRFDALVWQKDGQFQLEGSVVVRKSREQIAVTSHSNKGHDVAAANLYSESTTVVTEGSALQEDLEHFDDDDETLAEKMERITGAEKKRQNEEKKKLKKYTAGTLTVVLSQALRNNDHGLLETVLTNREPDVVQNTISRLDSSLAVVLLDRLSERITREQSRFDQLNFWLKWIVIIHGGVLSSMPNLSNKLASLHSILTKKASALPRLLELQGRLNMISQQSALKKEILSGSSRQNDYDDADTDVEYVEEIDDAAEAGILGSDDDLSEMGSDIDMDAVDDFEEEPEKVLDDEDGLSDVETAVAYGDVYE